MASSCLAPSNPGLCFGESFGAIVVARILNIASIGILGLYAFLLAMPLLVVVVLMRTIKPRWGDVPLPHPELPGEWRP